MGSNYATPPLEYLVQTVSNMVRMQTMVELEDAPASNIAMFYPKYSYYTLNQNYLNNPVRPLDKDDRLMLSSKAFINKALKNLYDVPAMHALICHLSWENLKFSRRVCKGALVGLNKAGSDEITNYIKIITQVLLIPDSLRMQRLEWLLGVPVPHFERSFYGASGSVQ